MASDITALTAFRKYLQKNRMNSMYLAVNLNYVIRDWLAQEYHYACFMDGLEPHVQASRIEFIESSIRAGWVQKGADTRAANKKNKKRAALAARQQTFHF